MTNPITAFLTSNPSIHVIEEFVDQIEQINQNLQSSLPAEKNIARPLIHRALVSLNHLISATSKVIFNECLLIRPWTHLNTHILHTYLTWAFSRDCENAKEFLDRVKKAGIEDPDFNQAIKRF